MTTYLFSGRSRLHCAALAAAFTLLTTASRAAESSGKPDISIDTPVFRAADDAEVVEIPKSNPSKAAEKHAEPKNDAAEVQIDSALDEALIKEKMLAAKKSQTLVPKPLEPSKPIAPAPKSGSRAALPEKFEEPGFAGVLTGTLKQDTEISAGTQPFLIRGVLIVPAKVTLKIGAGATVHLRSDPTAQKPAQPDLPDPTKSAVVWVYGTLIVAGESGKPVEFQGLDKDANANFLLYGGETSRIDGARFNGVDLAQSGGVCQWNNCEFNESKYYALACGAGLFTHCSFKKCGGIFAAYDDGPWALLARKCLFENCRDGLMFGRDPGQSCLIVEKNNFIGTRGANLRMMPRSSAALTGKAPEELLVGENWYGSKIDEEIEHRIVDNRTDRAIKAHLNLRPPAEKPYQNIGAGVSATTTAATMQEQQISSAKLLASLATKQKAALEKLKVAMERNGPASKKEIK